MATKKTSKTLAIGRFEKDYTALKNYMLGRGYHLALKALAFAELYHVGTRKDGYTPEFHHQITICWTIVNLRDIDDIEEYCLTLAFLHDVMEDYDISFDEMCRRFGEDVANDVYVLSKKHRGEVKNLATYHKELGEKAATIIVKGADNSHNVQSMHSAFKPEKIISYLEDTKGNKLPLLRLGRKRFPQYHFAFAGLSFMLKRQVELYEAHRDALAIAERTTRADRSKAILDAAANHTAVDQVAGLQARVDSMDAANRAINKELVEARQTLQFEKSKYVTPSMIL